MRRFLKKFEKMESVAYLSLKLGMYFVSVVSILLFSYILEADSFAEYYMLGKTIPAVVMSVFIVIGGAFALDVVIKEKRG